MKPGSVPTARISPILSALIRERWPQGGGIDVLAEKVGCDRDSVAAIIDQNHGGVSFDLADKLISTGLGRWDIWHGELADIYPTKFIETCALRSCNKTFPERFNGPTRKRYCSPRCATLANAVRRGMATGERLREKGYCLRGHKMTPDNTIKKWHKRDQRYNFQCRECKRIMQREWMRKKRAEDPSFGKKCAAAQRKWRASLAA